MLECHNWPVTSREGGGLSNLDSCITSASGSWSNGSQAGGSGLEKACHSTGSLDPTGAARDAVYAVDLNSMGGVIEEIGV